MKSDYSLASQDRDTLLKPVLELAKTCEYEAGHTHQVTFLALRLFDELQSLHDLDIQERFWLECAALLHDIGWIEGWRGHHKASLKIILSTPLLPFDSKERLIIGSIARYHRKSLPEIRHDHYAALEQQEQETVKMLAALLRVADGLDSAHQNRVKDLTCQVRGKKVNLSCAAPSLPEEEIARAEVKADLFQAVYKKKLVIRWENLL